MELLEELKLKKTNRAFIVLDQLTFFSQQAFVAEQ